MTQLTRCKMCGYVGDNFTRCENGSEYDDEGNFVDVTYCGALACPACCSCQGNTATYELQAAAAMTRAIKEHAPFSWIKPMWRGL